MKNNLHNGNLTLKRLELNDAPAIFELVEQNGAYLRKWLPWLDDSKTEEDTKAFVQEEVKKAENKQALTFVIYFDKKPVGLVGFIQIMAQARRAKIGYWLAENFQGKGIMTEAVRLLIDYGFSQLNLNKIEIDASPANSRSCAIPERLGFIKEGTIRDAEWLYDHFVDHAVYGLLAADWVPMTIEDM